LQFSAAHSAFRDVRVDDLRMAPVHQRLHLGYCLLGIDPPQEINAADPLSRQH
jgi:hypothetical protein